jgi:hypothetical protein
MVALRAGIRSSRLCQLQPQVLCVQAQPPEAGDSIADADPFEDFPALKTESCSVWRLLAHFGHAIFCVDDITSCS